MDQAKAREKIRENLDSGSLPKDFDLAGFNVGIPTNASCAGCGESFFTFDTHAIGRTRSGQTYWFHQSCDKIWEEERHRPKPRNSN